MPAVSAPAAHSTLLGRLGLLDYGYFSVDPDGDCQIVAVFKSKILDDNGWYGQSICDPHPKDNDAKVLALKNVAGFREDACDLIRFDPIFRRWLEENQSLHDKYTAQGIPWTTVDEYLERMRVPAKSPPPPSPTPPSPPPPSSRPPSPPPHHRHHPALPPITHTTESSPPSPTPPSPPLTSPPLPILLPHHRHHPALPPHHRHNPALPQALIHSRRSRRLG